MSAKAKALRTLYTRGKIGISGLREAVEKGVITEQEFKLICGQDY